MEYVEGETLLSYCDRLNLSIRDRISLFLDVTEAVQYAHKNLVVHRDLKPSNIMMTGDEGSQQVRLLDFGMLKSLRVPMENLRKAGRCLSAKLFSMNSMQMVLYSVSIFRAITNRKYSNLLHSQCSESI